MDERLTSPRLVGRSAELAALEESISRAAAGSAVSVLVGGEAGVGKSRLVAELVARSPHTRVVIGPCLELGVEGLPYAPFTAILRRLVRDLGAAAVGELLPGGPRELARLLPEFGEPPPESPEARARLFERVLMLMEGIADPGRPLVLVVEDAHWADRSTRDLLVFLVHNLQASGLVLLVTYRTDELHRSHPLRPVLHELERLPEVGRLELGRLSRTEVADQYAAILGHRPSETGLDAVYGRSLGNPLFVESLLACGGCDELPESIRDTLLAGVERLPEAARGVLRIAAAGGVHVGHELLAAVSELDETALTEALRAAVYANVLVADAEGYAFRHALIREAVHDDLLPGEHTRLHTRYAEALEATPGLVAPQRHAIETAHHWQSAHDVACALRWSWRAAEEARRSLAHAEELRMLEHVLQLWERVPDAAESIEADRFEVQTRAADAAADAGEHQRALALLNEALREYPAERDRTRAALLFNARGRLRRRMGDVDIEDLRLAAELIPAGHAKRPRLLESLAQALMVRNSDEDSRPLAKEALELAREAGDRYAEIHALITLSALSVDLDDSDRSLAVLAEARGLARAADLPAQEIRGFTNATHQLERQGRHEESAALGREGLERATELGIMRLQGSFLAGNVAESLFSLGRWDEASKVLEEGLGYRPPPSYTANLEVLVGEIALARGDLAAARRAVEHTHEVFVSPRSSREDRNSPVPLEARLLVAEGRPAEAVELIDATLFQPGECWGVRDGWIMATIGAEAAADVLTGSSSDRAQASAAGRGAAGAGPRVGAGVSAAGAERSGTGGTGTGGTGAGLTAAERAGEVLRRLIEAVEGWIVTLPLHEAMSLSFHAEVRRAGLSADAAAVWDAYDGAAVRDAYDGAAEAWVKVGQPYPRGRALRRSAEASAQLGDRDGVRQRLDLVAEIAASLGAEPLAGAARDLARRAGMPVGATADEAGLTPREFEVLRLVADGRSNRQIAEELFISAKTASVHVSNILGKLGVPTRGAAAAEAHRLGLFHPTAPTV
ncbi:MAG: AAA family ATPase [Streptosporangiales bacterium]|nr:AAA family ATPase [Streptosporangiales bacterium]